MRRLHIPLVALGIASAILSILPAIAAAAEVTGIEIVDYGVFTFAVMKKVDQDEHVSGYRVLGDVPTFKEKTTKIPAIKGLQFGVQYKVNGVRKGENVEIRVVDIFPKGGLTHPETGRTNTKNETVYIRKIGRFYTNGFIFEYPWELVPGQWTFQLWHGDQMLAEKAFTVYMP